MTPKEHAIRTIKRCGTDKPFEIADFFNVILVVTHLVGIRGFYQYHQRNNLIYLSEDLTESETEFVLLHEIGHMIMHKKQNAIFLDSRVFSPHSMYERQANSFAVEAKMTDDLIHKFKDYSIFDIARIVGIPEKLIDLKNFIH